MKTNTERILAIMNVLSWIVFIGLLIKAGAYLVSYGVSIGNPEAARNLYMGLNLSSLRQFDFWHYSATAFLMVVLEILKAYIAFLVIRVLSKIKLENPFKMEISKILERISYFIFATWIIAIIYNSYTNWLSQKITGLRTNMISEEFILLAGVVFVFSQIFKKGVELQSENELTV
jgi:hypothetical protein